MLIARTCRKYASMLGSISFKAEERVNYPILTVVFYNGKNDDAVGYNCSFQGIWLSVVLFRYTLKQTRIVWST